MRVVITQRVMEVPSVSERRDALAQSWFLTLQHLLEQPVVPIPLPNTLTEVARTLQVLSPDFFLLTGGNDLGYMEDAHSPASERDKIENEVLTYAEIEKIPVLGVCRGLQMMNHYLGGGLCPVNDHIATQHAVMAASFSHGPDTLIVNSYHKYGIPDTEIASRLEVLYVSTDGTVEAARHKQLPWLGVMWHPERENAQSDDQAAWLRLQLKDLYS